MPIDDLLMVPEIKDLIVHSKEDLDSDQSRPCQSNEGISNLYGDSVTGGRRKGEYAFIQHLHAPGTL